MLDELDEHTKVGESYAFSSTFSELAAYNAFQNEWI
jgi:hypothetical protein